MKAIVCDRCGKTQAPKPSVLRIKNTRSYELRLRRNPLCFGNYEENVDFDLCDDCAAALNGFLSEHNGRGGLRY